MPEKDQNRYIPLNDLELQAHLTDPAWGREITVELQSKLEAADIELEIDPNTGQPKITITALWELLAYHTRDIRLGNLSAWDGEYRYCIIWLDIAGDCLRYKYIRSFVAALQRVITILELSQSKSGFLRRRGGTITQEKIENPIDPPKKNIFGKKRSD